jgi:glyoxylase-like metal-dependent hydrolase (beta-lactamase superfamily II)
MIKALEPRVRTVAEGDEIFPGVHVMFTPGHSAGHAAYVISAGGQRVVAFGDAFHSPVQISHPLWENTCDHDHKQATTLRLDLVHDLAQPDVIGFGVHFAGAPFGRVRISDNHAAWLPIA